MNKHFCIDLVAPAVKFVAPKPSDLAAPGELFSQLAWFDRAIPVNSQGQHPRCEAYSTSNVIEMMLAAYVAPDFIPRGFQVSPDEIFENARTVVYPGKPVDEGGLPLGSSFAAAIRLGMLPLDTIIDDVEVTPAAINRALQLAPMVCGQSVHDGWWEPDRENGVLPWADGIEGLNGGHATALMGMDCEAIDGSTKPLVSIQNSWLDKDGTAWGRGGYGVIRWDDFTLNTLAPPKTVRVTGSWIDSLRNWVSQDGWKDKWLTNKWEGATE